MVVVSMAIVGLDSITTLSALNLALLLDLVPPPIVIYPVLPEPYGFSLELSPFPDPVLDLH